MAKDNFAVHGRENADSKFLEMLIVLRMEQIVGRYRLKELLDMQQHEGMVRRMLAKLAKWGWVRPTRSGCTFTQQGKDSVQKLLAEKTIMDIREVDFHSMQIGPKCIAAHIRRNYPQSSILLLRDEAVKAGANGAVILVYKGRDLAIPSVYKSLVGKFPSIFEELGSIFKLMEGDLIMVGFGETQSKAMAGVLAIISAMERNEMNK